MALLAAAQRIRSFDLGLLESDDAPLLLVLPGLFAFLAFMFFPMAYLVYLSFTNADASNLFQGKEVVVGVANYAMVLSSPDFWDSMVSTWLFVATSVVLKICLGLGVALILTSPWVKGKRVLRSLIIIPMATPTIFEVTVWRGIFSTARYGFVNQVLVNMGQQPVAWLTQQWPSFLAFNVTEMWLAYPFMFLIIVSALQDVPEELHDAARVDGAGYAHRFLHVTLPSIKKPLLFASILTAAASFQQFLIPYVFNKGNQAWVNELVLVYGYREAFSNQQYGEGAAIMIVALVFIGAFMIVAVKWGGIADGVNEA